MIRYSALSSSGGTARRGAISAVTAARCAFLQYVRQEDRAGGVVFQIRS